MFGAAGKRSVAAVASVRLAKSWDLESCWLQDQT